MKNAIEVVRENRMEWMATSKMCGVPQATLRRHALNTNKTLPSNAKGLRRFRKVQVQTFLPEIERQLVDHIKFLETTLFDLTRTRQATKALFDANENLLTSKGPAKKRKRVVKSLVCQCGH